MQDKSRCQEGLQGIPYQPRKPGLLLPGLPQSCAQVVSATGAGRMRIPCLGWGWPSWLSCEGTELSSACSPVLRRPRVHVTERSWGSWPIAVVLGRDRHRGVQAHTFLRSPGRGAGHLRSSCRSGPSAPALGCPSLRSPTVPSLLVPLTQQDGARGKILIDEAWKR